MNNIDIRAYIISNFKEDNIEEIRNGIDNYLFDDEFKLFTRLKYDKKMRLKNIALEMM